MKLNGLTKWFGNFSGIIIQNYSTTTAMIVRTNIEDMVEAYREITAGKAGDSIVSLLSIYYVNLL